MNAKKIFPVLVLFLAGFAFAQVPSEDIALNLRADTFNVHVGDSFSIIFDIYNPMPQGDNVIDRIDVFLLDLNGLGLKAESWQKNNWQHSFNERFQADQFFIANAVSQPLSITVKAGSNLKSGTINGFFSFQKTTGTQALKTGENFEIKINALQAGQAAQAPSKTEVPAKEQELNNTIMALSAVIIILAIALVFFIVKNAKKSQMHKTAFHKK